MRVARFDADGDGDAAAWDSFVLPRAGSVTDLSAWSRVVRDAYGLRSHLLAVSDQGRVTGALGLCEVAHPVFGRYLTTAAFGNDGGFHFDDAGARDALLVEAKQLAASRDASYLLVRTREQAFEGWQLDDHYCTAVIDLDGGPDAAWKRLPAKTRNQVRRGMKEGFTLAIGHGELEAFFDVFHRHMRDLGSPAHSRRFYRAILEHLGDRTEFLVVRDGNTLVAGALLFWINGTAMNYHTVALTEFNRRCPNYLLYWRMIEAACARGCSRFDMGRSEAGGSNLRFKANWGPRESTLCYNYFLRKRKAIPYLDPRNPRYRIPIALWRKTPLMVTRRLGPHLISGLA